MYYEMRKMANIGVYEKKERKEKRHKRKHEHRKAMEV